MDKNAIKKYAVWARTELIERVRQRALKYEVVADADVGADSASGKVLTDIEKTQRAAGIARMREKGYEYVIEEVAYTWFNRFAALRYMEVNNYLPTRVRVFTDENGAFKPQILTEAIHLNLDGLDMEKVYALKEVENNDELYRYLLITQCNALSAVLPQMFKPVDERCKEEKNDYTILLFPDNQLREGSVIEQMVTLIPEDNWLDAVQIIGWLYQYYNSEPKDKVFADLKKNIKITKENIPAATQLFTPDWIVRYMVENSLGRLWLEEHPQNAEELLPTEEEQAAYIAGDRNSEDSKWHYYLKEAEQEPEVEAQLAEIRKEYAALKPEDILCIDPCMGSGHIIVYMFDALMKIYAAYGYSTRESVQSIIEHNLYGLDIDDRAAQLAYFAVMMKAVQYDSRFLKRKDEDDNPDIPQPHVYAIKESNHLDSHAVEYFCNGDKKLTDAMHTLIEEMHDATEYGSILNVTQVDFAALYARFDEVKSDISMYREVALNELLPLVQVAQDLAQKYDVVVTNPPYMGTKKMNSNLVEFAKTNYPNSKADMFAIFIERCNFMLKSNGVQAMITQHAWMFLDSFKDLRENVLHTTIVNMAHLGTRAFEEIGGEVVQTTAFVLTKKELFTHKGVYVRLVDELSQDDKQRAFLAKKNVFNIEQSSFFHIETRQIAYWLGDSALSLFDGKKISDYSDACYGFITGNNDKYLRLWHEVQINRICFDASDNDEFREKEAIYAPCNKGGTFRKWYGNNDYIAMWSSRDEFHRNGSTYQYAFFKKGLTWSVLSSNKFNCRFYDDGFVFDHAAASLFVDDIDTLNYLVGYLNSSVFDLLLNAMNPTINSGAEIVSQIPAICTEEEKEKVAEISEKNIEICREDWNSFEMSWDFKRHPLLDYMVEAERETLVEKANQNGAYIDTTVETYLSIENAYSNWVIGCDRRFNQLKTNEEELNRIFIDIYGLQDELTPEVEDKDITVRKADLQRDIKSFISYAVGCMLGRYSLDTEGLAYAGGTWNASKYQTFPVDKDNIIPICDDEYFEDDITGLFIKFVATVYGKNTLSENLKFIANALGGKGTPKEVIRNYFLNDFFADHCKMYQKRPIYWLFDSGKKNGFKALVYMHRYQPDTIARMRTDYVHEQQSRYRTAITDLENRIADASTSERVRLNKQLSKLRDQSEEIRKYEEKIHHLADQYITFDLDDGVKHNYGLFSEVLSVIK